MRMYWDSPALPLLPISMLLLPVVRLVPAESPKAMLLLPVVLLSALNPKHVLLLPFVLKKRAPLPIAVLLLPKPLRPMAGGPDCRIVVAWAVLEEGFKANRN